MELWNGSELWQVAQMAEAIPDARRSELRELVSVFHTSDPKALMESLKHVHRTKEESLATVAEMMGNQKAAAEIRRNERIKSWLTTQQNS